MSPDIPRPDIRLFDHTGYSWVPVRLGRCARAAPIPLHHSQFLRLRLYAIREKRF